MARASCTSLLVLAVLLPALVHALRPVQEGRDGIHQQRKGGEGRQNDEQDRVLHVPGYHGQLKSKHYAGYIPVGESKQLFYYMVESERNPAEDPVVLWLNGGPGCSSFDGFVYEMGPFLFSSAPSAGASKGAPQVLLSDNPYAWNKVATMIYLDSPAGVGLSYSTNQADYFTGDGQTATDANIFLRGFFERHAQFQDNPFFISGESYAGIYVPNLARAVVEGNEGGQTPYINLVGYLVGNGVTDEEVDGDAFPLFAEGKSLVSHHLYHQLKEACGGVYWNRTSSECDMYYYKMTEELSSLNIYNILQDCYRGPNPDASAALHLQYTNALRSHGPRWPAPGFASRPGPTVNFAHLGLTPPCTDSRLAFTWLNDNAVRAALNALPYSAADSVWQLCSDRIFYTREISSMIPIHRNLTGPYGLMALIYSGDHDLAVPHTGSERWTRELGLPVRREWSPWYDSARQVGGYYVEFEGLTYATVKGAGHMVPQTNPRQALSMFERFIKQGSLGQALWTTAAEL